ncbi:ribosomal RNA processing protein 36 homolog isoform X2 [Neopsephotus bourkii]|uniref:ribosomal RNA processing protein 36 homolog isoform X2 n=1 Tax=Neopsephotus bourkii TaxID=309878 RepID=UPI002AA55C1C|nr:ribosomal RNA processing protein 36 homolog isoform X2 [Neopsephotus bourkii]
MTIFCSHCHRPLQAEMSCLPRRGKEVPRASKPFRSTKSASKARRDQINMELQALRSLLPISAREKERLSYLHTMALVCLQLRGAQLFPPGTHSTAAPHMSLALRGALLLPHHGSASPCDPSPADCAAPAGPALGTELLSLLPGFLLVLSANGKLVYVSENVAQVLGLSMVRPAHCGHCPHVPVLVPFPCACGSSGLPGSPQPLCCQVELLAHGDTVFDILDQQGHEDVRKKLLLAQEEPGREVTFVCEMRTSKAFQQQHGGNRAVVVRGRFTALRWPPSRSATAFLALCSPVRQLPADAGSQEDLFQSTHSLDMTFTNATESVIYHLGYHREELMGQSWYSLLHPEDADLAASQHRAVDLSHMSFEELLQMQNDSRTSVCKQVTSGKKTAKPTKATVKQQQGKKGPLEMSAKKPVPFLRQVVSVRKKVHRDPRFDDLSGEYKPEIFMKTYSFLESIKKQEKEMIQKQLKKCRNVEQKEKLQQLLNRMTQQEQALQKQQKLRERELSWKRQQRELAKQGKKPFFLKKSEMKKLELADKYAELKRSGKLESFLNKKRKRNAIKDKRRLPSQKSL